MNEYSARVMDRIIDKFGPVTTVISLAIINRWPVMVSFGGAGGLFLGAKALGWF